MSETQTIRCPRCGAEMRPYLYRAGTPARVDFQCRRCEGLQAVTVYDCGRCEGQGCPECHGQGWVLNSSPRVGGEIMTYEEASKRALQILLDAERRREEAAQREADQYEREQEDDREEWLKSLPPDQLGEEFWRGKFVRLEREHEILKKALAESTQKEVEATEAARTFESDALRCGRLAWEAEAELKMAREDIELQVAAHKDACAHITELDGERCKLIEEKHALAEQLAGRHPENQRLMGKLLIAQRKIGKLFKVTFTQRRRETFMDGGVSDITIDPEEYGTEGILDTLALAGELLAEQAPWPKADVCPEAEVTDKAECTVPCPTCKGRGQVDEDLHPKDLSKVHQIEPEKK